jgi:diaminobutyrate-2-oxoglutarate transaminase
MTTLQSPEKSLTTIDLNGEKVIKIVNSPRKGTRATIELFENYESEVRGYCRSFPEVFDTAKGSWLIDRNGNRYLDFFAGAGVLNYGHNNEKLKRTLLDYIERDGVIHTLDMYSVAKEKFIETFQKRVLQPRGLSYKLQFPGPTGTNAVEAALKLARKVTGREGIISFTNSFHGMTLGSLSVTGNGFKRKGAGVALSDVVSMPFEGYMGEDVDAIEYLRVMLEDEGSGMDKPAAVILETVQAEGGINVASMEWLKRLHELTREHDMLMIVDDIQVGCGRTGSFFSFEEAGIQPDIVTLSKSLSGYGLPFALVLIKPEHDQWEPGEHNGTFRGHNPAFVTAAAALELFWKDDTFQKEITRKANLVRSELQKMLKQFGITGSIRGRGLIQGIEFEDSELAGEISEACFENGLVIETAGVNGQVLKLLPPLTITDAEILQGIAIIKDSIRAVLEIKSQATEISAQLETAEVAA